MLTETTDLSMVRDFINVLKRAWPTDDCQFNRKDEAFYRDNLILFCNKARADRISNGDLQTVLGFVYDSITHILDIVIRDGSISDYVKECSSYILIFLDHIALNLNPRFITSDFFIRILKVLLSIPATIDSLQVTETIMAFYDSSDILHRVCHYMNSLNISGIEENTLSNFMKKARYTPQSRLFRFYLYGFNDQYFRKNYPTFADECNAKELYFGILYNYFKLTYNGEVYNVFINMCNNVSDDIIYLKDHTNPVYNYYLLSQDNRHLSLKDIYPQLGRLFHN